MFGGFFTGVIRYVGYVELAENSAADLGVPWPVFLTALVLELCTLSRHSQFEI